MAKSQPNGLDMEQCTIVGLEDSPLVYDADCYTSDYCFMCEFADITYFNIRGLCDNLNSILDKIELL